MTAEPESPVAGVVLAAGLGTRLRPLTDLRPKALCPVANVALVDLALAHLLPWCEAVAVNVHAGRAAMEAHLAGRGLHLSVEDPGPLGTAGALGRLREWVAGRAVLVGNADAWHRFDLGVLLEGWDGHRIRLLAVKDAARGDFGPWRYCGSALMPWADVARLEAVPSGLYEMSWRKAEAEGRLELVGVGDGPFFDCGTPPDYLAANLAASGGESVVGPGAVVEGELVRSVVWPGGVVAAGERLVESIRAGRDVTVPAPLAFRDRGPGAGDFGRHPRAPGG
jgi:N-acetyl-alpha-D-muramate 1-phosphate uridylyltransferase